MSNDLSSRAMLARLSISVWTARKHDKRADEIVEHRTGAQDAGRFNKLLVAQEAIKAVFSTANAVRTFHYQNTLPWSEGDRLLSAANFQTYSAAIRQHRQQFESSVGTFVSNYSVLVDDARTRLNGLFNPADYPRDIAGRFGFEATILPVPIGDDFRVSLCDDELAQVRGEIDRNAKAALAAAHQDLYRRLAEAIGHMADRLGDKDAIFRDSLVDNLRELCGLLPRLDVLGDPELERIRREAENRLLCHAPQTLRESDRARVQTATDAQAILAAMEGMYNV